MAGRMVTEEIFSFLVRLPGRAEGPCVTGVFFVVRWIHRFGVRYRTGVSRCKDLDLFDLPVGQEGRLCVEETLWTGLRSP